MCALCIVIGVCGAISNPLSYLGVAILLLGMVPLILLLFRKDNRQSYVNLAVAHANGQLKEAVGPRAEAINEGAIDLEQIIASLRQSTSKDINQDELIALAEGRLRRALELTIGTPAAYSFTRERADQQIDDDLAWLSEVRQHSERLLVASGPPDESDQHVRELKAIIAAREDALDELGLGS